VNARRLALNSSLLLGSSVAAILLVEIALRLVAPPTDAGDTTLLTEYDSLLGWSKIPGASQVIRTTEFEIEETINSLGLRGPEYPYEKPDGTVRVLLLGDSFLEGYTVSLDSLVSTLLEKRLNQASPARYEVINGGTAGYSTDQEVLFSESEGRRYAPDVTVLMFYVNDVWFNAQSRYWRGNKPRFRLVDSTLALTNVPVPPPDSSEFAFAVQGGAGIVGVLRRTEAWLARHSALYQLARKALTNSILGYRLTVKLGLAEIPGEFRAWYGDPQPGSQIAEAWDVTDALLARLAMATREAGSRFVVFYVPSRPVVDPEDWRKTARKYDMPLSEWDPTNDGVRLSAACQRQALDCIVAPSAFRHAADTLAAAGRALYFERDAHWTSDGHALAARLLAEHLLAGMPDTADTRAP
jgi:GDSL-like Lipase/Acylhydrolase family